MVVTLAICVVVLAGPGRLAASPANHPNLGAYVGEAVVHRDRHGPMVDSCRVTARLWASGARLRIQSCWEPEPFSHCSFPLTYVGRVGLGQWKWRISGVGRDTNGQTCAAPRSIPLQTVKMYGTSYAGRHTFTVRTRGGKVLDTTLERP